MKIDKSSKPLPVAPATDGKARVPAAKPEESAPPAANGTSVSLGAASVQLRNMENGMANAPSVNAAKVAEIKQAISEGRFQVNAGAVADSLIRSVTDLLSTQKT